MRYSEIRPGAELAPFVRCLWELSGEPEALAAPIFPDGCAELVVHLGSRPAKAGTALSQPAVMIVGQMTEAMRLAAPGPVHAIGVRFTPAGARACFGLPMHELTNAIQPLEALPGAVSPLASVLQEAACDSASPHQPAVQVAARLREALPSGLTVDRGIERAVRAAERRGGRIGVDALAAMAALGPRQLERRFLDVVGLPPKTFLRTLRFQQALRALRRGARPAAAAADCGYADQPHLAREFRRFAGAAARDVDLAHVAFVQDGPAADRAD